MSRKSGPDPQTRILDAAEKAVADAGFAGASLRTIVLEAGVNLATVYYYFGSKVGLMEAVLKRRFGPLRQEHLALLRQFEARTKGRPLPVEKILEAMLQPLLRLAAEGPADHHAVTRLLGRIVSEPNREIQQVLRSQRAEVRTAFLKAFQRTLPRTPTPYLLWCMEFVWGALAFALCNPRKIEIETRGACDPSKSGEVLSTMLQFFSPGFHAPARRSRRASA
jgi:AcrR family transcriptional regulator